MKRFKNINRSMLESRIVQFSKQLENGALILDIGAGTGHCRRFFEKQRYYAIDRGYEHNTLAGLDIAADIAALPLPDKLADAIICVEVIEHLPRPEFLLREAQRVLKSGGSMLITSPLCYGEHMQPYDYCRYTRFALESMYQSAGFHIARYDTRGGFFILLAFLLAKVPDQISSHFGRRLLGRILKPITRLIFTYGLAPLMAKLDFLDSKKSFTLGFCYELTKASSGGKSCL